MLKWAPYPFLRVALCLSAGILTYVFWGTRPELTVPLGAFFLLLYCLLRVLGRLKKSIDINNLAGIAALFFFYVAGILLTHFHTAKTYNSNLLHHPGHISYYEGVVDDYISYKPKTIGTTLAVRKIKVNGAWVPVTGKVRLTLNKEAGPVSINYGDVLLIKGTPALVQPPLNPEQFNYQQYLAKQQVYHQHYLYSNQFLKTGHAPAYFIIEVSIRIRNFLDQKLSENITSDTEYGIATALVLGIRDYLPEDIKTIYASTGTIHVLAVSGLHVGLLFLLLNNLIGKWSERRGYKIMAFILLLGFILLYGFVTALSASVLRAVVMFSFVLVADTFRKQLNIYNTLAASAFILLLINPYYLLDVGFQLSFLAVLGIIYFQPKIYAWLNFNNRVPDYCWQLISGSLAAQLAVLPLNFYYFHQFPVDFLLANLVAIPLSNIALVLGFLLLGLSWVPLVPVWLGWALQQLLWLMNVLSSWLLYLPFSTISGIYLTQTQAWLLYALLFLVSVFIARKKLRYFALFTFILLVFSGMRVATEITRNKANYFVVYRVPRATAMAFISGRQVTLLADSAFYANPKNFQFNIQPHWVKLGVSSINYDTLTYITQQHAHVASAMLPDGNMLFRWKNLNILRCIKPVTTYNLDALALNFIILDHRAFLSPATLPNKKTKFQAVLGNTNSKGYNRKVGEILTTAGIPIWNINEQGALAFPIP